MQQERGGPARGLGAHAVIVMSDEDALEVCAQSLDLLIDTVPCAHEITPCLKLMKPGGVIALVGNFIKVAAFVPADLVFHRLTLADPLIGSTANTAEVLEPCPEHSIRPRTEPINMDEINRDRERLEEQDVRLRHVIDMPSLKSSRVEAGWETDEIAPPKRGKVTGPARHSSRDAPWRATKPACVSFTAHIKRQGGCVAAYVGGGSGRRRGLQPDHQKGDTRLVQDKAEEAVLAGLKGKACLPAQALRLGGDQNRTAWRRPNPGLVPEKKASTEIGFALNFADFAAKGDRLQAKVSYFETDAQDMINLTVNVAADASCFAPPFFQPCTFGTSNAANIDRAELEGFEAEVHYESDLFFARASFAAIDGTDLSDGSDLGSLTPDRFALNAGVKLEAWNARIGARFQHASDFAQRVAGPAGGFILTDVRDAYCVIDLYATWRPAFANGVRFDAGIDNVLDENYERVFAGVSEPARNFKIAASWQFGQ